MRLSHHTEQRIEERLRGQLKLSKKKVNHIKRKMLRAGMVHPWKYQAVRIEKLDKKVRLNKRTESSYGWGDELWAIIKNNVVVTTMFRNSNKPTTPKHFDGEVKLIWSLV